MAETRTVQFGVMEQSVVREVANIGLGNAITALSSLTQRSFNMTIPNVESVPLEELPMRLGGNEQIAVGIYMPIESTFQAQMAFLLPWDCACALWRMILGTAPESPESVSELDASVMLEVGNIINSNFLNAIADMTDLPMHATPPSVSIDMSIAILGSIVTEASLGGHYALSIQTKIHDQDMTFDGFFAFIPSLDGLRQVFQKLGIAEAA